MPYGTASRNRPETVLLGADEEVALAQQIEAGGECGEEAKRHFVASNIGLAISMAMKYRAPAYVSRDDMIQDAMIGLEQAVARFDWRLGYRFSTYAGWWIRQAIQQGLEYTAAPVRMPTHRTQELHVALAAVDGELKSLPSTLASTLAMSGASSLDAVVERVGDVADPADEVIAAHDRECVRELVATLNQTSRYAVVRRFGLDGQPPVTFTEIGVELGVSAEAARRRVLRSLKALRPEATVCMSSEAAQRSAA